MAALKSRDRHLLYVSVSQKTIVNNLRYGAEIERQLGMPIDTVVLSVCADRYRLAKQFLSSAKKVLSMKPPQFRSAISRYYYSMYHAARAVVYVAHGGDDFEAHSTLSQNLPDDFPNVAVWRNSLREARLLRNKVDYEPYPKLQKSFAADSDELIKKAKDFLSLSEQYLVARGCAI